MSEQKSNKPDRLAVLPETDDDSELFCVQEAKTNSLSLCKSEITSEKLHEIFRYDPVNGKLFRKRNNKLVKTENQRVTFYVSKKRYEVSAHLLIWCLCYDKWAENIVIHKDFDKTNNRLNNLMEISNKDFFIVLNAYNNLMKNCIPKQHKKFPDTFVVKHVQNGITRVSTHYDLSSALLKSEKLKLHYRRIIIDLGCVPPSIR